MEAATWEALQADFVPDGALIDLRIPGTGEAEWEAFWSALRVGPFGLRAFRDAEPIPLPDSAVWAIAEREFASVMVAVRTGSVTANCHFFGGDLELDIYPPEVNSATAFESVLALMQFVAAAVRLPMLALVENGSPEYAFLRVSPDGQAEFLRKGSVRHAEPYTPPTPARPSDST